MDAVPVAIEALGPGVERVRVVAAQVLDVDDLQPAASIATMVCARLGIQPPGNTWRRMKNSVSRTPT